MLQAGRFSGRYFNGDAWAPEGITLPEDLQAAPTRTAPSTRPGCTGGCSTSAACSELQACVHQYLHDGMDDRRLRRTAAAQFLGPGPARLGSARRGGGCRAGHGLKQLGAQGRFGGEAAGLPRTGKAARTRAAVLGWSSV